MDPKKTTSDDFLAALPLANLVELSTEDNSRVQVPLALLYTLGAPFLKSITALEKAPPNGNGPMQIKLKYTNRDILQLLVAFIHRRSIHLEPLTVWKMVNFAKYYKAEPLLEECYKYLVDRITPINCMCLWMESTEDGGPGSLLKSPVEEFLRNNFEQVSKSNPEFPLIQVEHLYRLLTHDKLNVSSEEQVWEAIARWTNFDLNNRRHALPNLLETLRFGRLDEQYLKWNIASSSLVKSHQPSTKLLKDMLTKYSSLRIGTWDVSLGLMRNSKNIACRPRVPREVIAVYGGWTNILMPSSSLELYDWQAGQWVEHKLPLNIAYCGLEWLDGCLFIIGGTDQQSDHSNTLYRFDLLNRVVTKLAPMSSRRCYVATVTLNGQLWACGGHDGDARLDTCERFDPALNIWLPIAAMNVVRSDAAATVHRGQIYIAGGVNSEGVENSVEVYNPAIDRWTMIEQLSFPRSSLALVSYHERLYAIGGYNGLGRTKEVECYDFKQRCWTSVAQLNMDRSTFGAIVFKDRLYAINGYSLQTLQCVEMYSEESNSWKIMLQKTNKARSGFGVAVISDLPNMEVYTFNGMKT